MIVTDTREKRNEHILKYFDRHNVQHVTGKLDAGDYMDTDHPLTRVERKANLAEMAHNLLTKDRKRFYAEVRRARAEGIQLVVLCEEPGINTVEDVKNWKPRYGKASGRSLADAIFKLEIGYGVPTFYCGKRSAGKRILEILAMEE